VLADIKYYLIILGETVTNIFDFSRSVLVDDVLRHPIYNYVLSSKALRKE